MEINEIVDFISSDGLRRILSGLKQPYSYPRPALISLVLFASQQTKTRTLLRYLALEDIKQICRRKELPVGGTKDELIDQLIKHKEKIVTYQGLILDIKRWRPLHSYRGEQGYTDDLHKFLEEKGYKCTQKGGATLPDLLVDDKYPIEMKWQFNSKTQWNRAAGQVIEYTNKFGCAILVICYFYADKIELAEILEQILTPDLRQKCQVILKE